MPSFLSSGGLDLCLVPVFDKQALLKSSNPPITEGKPPGSLVFSHVRSISYFIRTDNDKTKQIPSDCSERICIFMIYNSSSYCLVIVLQTFCNFTSHPQPGKCRTSDNRTSRPPPTESDGRLPGCGIRSGAGGGGRCGLPPESPL